MSLRHETLGSRRRDRRRARGRRERRRRGEDAFVETGGLLLGRVVGHRATSGRSLGRRHADDHGLRALGKRDDRVADGDRAVGEDVGVDARAVGELLDDPRPRHRLEMPARLAELHAEALDLADAEALADERVEVDAARRHLPPRRASRQADRLDVLSLHECQRLTRLGAAVAKVAISVEAFAGDGADGVDRPKLAAFIGAEVDRFDAHASMIAEAVERATIHDSNFTGGTRNVVSVTAVRGLGHRGCLLAGADDLNSCPRRGMRGANPAARIDVEPNSAGPIVGVRIVGNRIESNAGPGILVALSPVSAKPRDVAVVGNRIIGNGLKPTPPVRSGIVVSGNRGAVTIAPQPDRTELRLAAGVARLTPNSVCCAGTSRRYRRPFYQRANSVTLGSKRPPGLIAFG